MYVQVCVDAATYSDDLFSYRIPEKFENHIHIGSRVFVEFGFQKTMAYVLAIIDEADYGGNIKDIIDVVDFEHGLTAEQIKLAQAICRDTKAPLSQCLRLMYPSFMQSKIKKYAVLINPEKLSENISDLFRGRKKIVITADILPYYKKIKEEEAKGNLEIVTDVYTYGKRKVVNEYRLIKEEAARSEKQQAVIDYLQAAKQATADDISENTGTSPIIIKKMAARGLLEVIATFPQPSPPPKYFPQKINFDFAETQIVDKFQRLDGKPFLFYTDNEDFRLRFYVDAIRRTVAGGRKVLFLMPTLLAASSLELYLRKKMPDLRILAFSSAISNGEFYYNFQNVISGNADLVITTMVGVFLPLADIGLIVMIDEEHHNYINQQNPKFSTKEVLKIRAEYHQAKLLLVTSAPSVDSYYRYTHAEYYLLELLKQEDRRFKLINVRDEPADMLITSTLREEIKQAIADKQIAMLVLNNLGYSTVNICANCGNLIKCPKCKIGLVYYKDKKFYRCYYCNQRYDRVECDKCHTSTVKQMGYGLEKLAERLHQYFPQARLYRVSSLSMQRADDYNAFFAALEEKTVDIVIGTNILLDMVGPEIGLIALINADTILHAADYRSAEVCYRTISKTLDFKKSSIIIQGYNLDHYAVTGALKQDFLSFYNAEITVRGYALYPPYHELNKVTIIGDFKDMYYYANYFKKVFNRFNKGDCLGPVYVAKTRGVQLTIKHNDFAFFSALLDEVNKKFKNKKLWVNFERYPRFYD